MFRRAVADAAQRRPGDSQAGAGLVELMVASSILVVGVLGLLSSISLGFVYVGVARQRQSAAAVGQEQIEAARGMAYENVSLRAYPLWRPDGPDSGLSADGALYNVAGTGADCVLPVAGECEAIVIDALNGLIDHTQTRTTGAAEVKLYAYVTWVDDPDVAGTLDYKRLTVIAEWARTQKDAGADVVRLQTFVGTGKIQIPATTPGPSAAPSPSPVPTASWSPAPVECVGAPPTGSLVLLSSAGAQSGYTNSTQVTVQLTATATCAPLIGELSDDGVAFGSPIALESASAAQASWTLSSGDGSKIVRAVRRRARSSLDAGRRVHRRGHHAARRPGTATRVVLLDKRRPPVRDAHLDRRRRRRVAGLPSLQVGRRRHTGGGRHRRRHVDRLDGRVLEERCRRIHGGGVRRRRERVRAVVAGEHREPELCVTIPGGRSSS